jgi:SAM-dependent methyltransferase
MRRIAGVYGTGERPSAVKAAIIGSRDGAARRTVLLSEGYRKGLRPAAHSRAGSACCRSLGTRSRRGSEPVKRLLTAAVLAGVAGVLWLRRNPVPCPVWLAFVLENPYVERVAGGAALLDRAGVRTGMRVLDVGCGTGRVTVPAARRVGPAGEVVGLDLQPEMLRRARRKARGLSNVRFVAGDVVETPLEEGYFDLALVVGVLGELRDREGALRAVHRALRPGGLLSITEVFGDPDYRGRRAVRELGESAGFRYAGEAGSFLSFTVNFKKPI